MGFSEDLDKDGFFLYELINPHIEQAPVFERLFSLVSHTPFLIYISIGAWLLGMKKGSAEVSLGLASGAQGQDTRVPDVRFAVVSASCNVIVL